MDKLKEKLGPAVVYVFWGVLALVILASTAVWWMASGDVATKIASQSSAIKTAFSNVTNLQSSASTHPNSHSHEQMLVRVEVAKKDVVASWQKQWDHQKEILVWDESLNARGTRDFTSVFEQFLPIETTTEYPITSENASKDVTQTLRKRYKLYIENTLDSLAEIVGAKWTADFKSKSNGMMGGGMLGYGAEDTGDDEGEMGTMGTLSSTEPDTLLTWSTSSQDELLEQMFPWRAKQEPDTLDILYSQEDLWVAKGLLHIIADVNKGATQRFQADIREILSLKLGKRVAGRVGSISGITSGNALGMDEEGYDTMASEGFDEGGSMTGEVLSVDPADNRYVDNEYKPVPSSTLRSAMAGADPSQAFLNVAKRLPVMMSLKMDQRKVPKLLAACANATLQVEVRQVRINPSAAGLAGMAATMSMMMEEDGGGSGLPSVAQAPERYPYDLPIEVYGVIYIYNPPDMQKLGVEEIKADTELETTSIGEANDAQPVEAVVAPDAATPADPSGTPADPAAAPADPAAPANPGAAAPVPVNPAPVAPAPAAP